MRRDALRKRFLLRSTSATTVNDEITITCATEVRLDEIANKMMILVAADYCCRICLLLQQRHGAIEPCFRALNIQKEVNHAIVQLELARQQWRCFRFVFGNLQQFEPQQRRAGIEGRARLQSLIGGVEEE